jgi:hypothetical protein
VQRVYAVKMEAAIKQQAGIHKKIYNPNIRIHEVSLIGIKKL